MLLYVNNVMRFLDTPFLSNHAVGTALTILMVDRSCRYKSSLGAAIICLVAEQFGRGAIRRNNINCCTTSRRGQHRAGIPAPKIVIIADSDPNAFAVGIRPEDSYILVTTALISTLDREELQGVVAHEMSHIRNSDTQLMTVITVLFGGILVLAEWMRKIIFWNAPVLPKVPGASFVVKFVFFIFWILAVLFAPLIARILAMSVSREREYLADAGAAELTRNPIALANALAKIERHAEPSSLDPEKRRPPVRCRPAGQKDQQERRILEQFLWHPPADRKENHAVTGDGISGIVRDLRYALELQ